MRAEFFPHSLLKSAAQEFIEGAQAGRLAPYGVRQPRLTLKYRAAAPALPMNGRWTTPGRPEVGWRALPAGRLPTRRLGGVAPPPRVCRNLGSSGRACSGSADSTARKASGLIGY